MHSDVVKARIRWLIAGAVALWLSSVFYTVNTEEYAVVTFFGRPIRVVKNAGLHLKFPLPINTVDRVDKRLLVYDTLATEYLTRDKKNIIAQCYAVWQITDPGQLLKVLGDRVGAEQKLDEHLSSALGAAFGQYEFDSLVNKETDEVRIEEMLTGVEQAVNQTAQDGNYGIRIASVELTRLSYPDATLESVFKRMRTERKVIADGYRAEGTREATRIRSEADLKRAEILSAAREEADKIRGQAEREAAAVFAGAYSGNPSFWRYWRKLQAMEKVIDQDTTIYMTPDIPLFSPLVSTPAAQ